MSNLQEFISFVKQDGLARQNRFLVSFVPPALFFQKNVSQIMMLCKGVSLPGINVSTTGVRLTGEVMEVPYDRTFTGANMTFYADRRMMNRRFFDIWIELIQHPDSRVLSYYDDFTTKQMEIYVLDKSDRQTYKVVLYDVFVKSGPGLALDYDVNGVMTFDVSFEYRRYKTEMVMQAGGDMLAGSPYRSLEHPGSGNTGELPYMSIEELAKQHNTTSEQIIASSLVADTETSTGTTVNYLSNMFRPFYDNLNLNNIVNVAVQNAIYGEGGTGANATDQVKRAAMDTVLPKNINVSPSLLKIR